MVQPRAIVTNASWDGNPMLGLKKALLVLLVLNSAVVAAGTNEGEAPTTEQPGTFRLDRSIFDTAGALTSLEITRLQELCDDFQMQSGYPAGVVILKHLSETGSAPTDDKWAVTEKLLNQWKSGRNNSENAVLVILATEDRYVCIRLGRAWGGGFDALINEVIERVMKPALSKSDADGKTRKPDVMGAMMGALQELMPAMVRDQQSAGGVLASSLRRFLAASWLWILAALHGLGFVYVLSTKEDPQWYLAGLLLGLPIFLGMLVLVLQGERSSVAVLSLRRPAGAPPSVERAYAGMNW